jgi:hypothetical protein
MSNFNSKLLLFRGLGNKEFSEMIEWKSLGGRSPVVPIDSDLDGKMELLVYSKYGSDIYRFFPGNTEYNEIHINSSSTIETSGSHLYKIDIADLNKDNYPDILTANRSSRNISVLINDENGDFNETLIPLMQEPYSIGAFDYNKDAWDDLLVLIKLDQEDFVLQVLLNDKMGGFMEYTTYPINGFFDEPTNLEKIDLDNDQDLDIIISNWDYGESVVLENLSEQDTLINLGDKLIKSNHQLGRDYSDVNNDELIDIVDGFFYPGDITIRLNNSVLNPLDPTIEISYDTIKHNAIQVILDNVQTTGSIAVLKEGTGLNFVPEDGRHYVKNASFGVGENVEENAYVVFSAADTTFTVSDLKSNTTYELSVFEFNSNAPDNNIINYGSESVVSTFTTKRAIFSIQDFPDTIKIDEDSVLTLELKEYINDFGENSYELTNQNAEVNASLSGTSLTVTPNKDYYGMDSISVVASLPTESMQIGFHLQILPVNDPPVIQDIDPVVINTDTPGEPEVVAVPYEDPDTEAENLRIEVTSSNQDVVSDDGIQVSINNGELLIEYNSSGYGISVITIKITDENGDETIMTFNVEVSEVTGLENLEADCIIYPNPTSGMVYLNRKYSEHLVSGTISNTLGEIVLNNINLRQGEIDLSNLPPGIFLLKSGGQLIKIIKE